MKNTVSYWKKKTWSVFSELVRRIECDKKGYGRCITCGILNFWKKLQAGHFIPGRHNSILFDRRGVHIQCSGCNVFKRGNSIKYFRWMQKHYGEEVIKDLERIDKQMKQFTVQELKDLYDTFKKELSELK